MRVARLATRHPEVIGLLRQGRISVSGLVSIAPHADDRPDLIEKAVDKSSRAIEAMVAGEKPDALSPRGHSSAKPVGPQTFKLEVVVSEEQLEKIEAARGLLRHRNPEGDLAAIIELAMDVLIAKVEKQRFRVTDRPRKTGSAATSDNVRAELARQVYARDEGRCTWVGDDGLEAAMARDHEDREVRRADNRCAKPRTEVARESERAALIFDYESTLRNMGFSPAQARSSTRRAANERPDATSVESLIRAALRLLVPVHPHAPALP